MTVLGMITFDATDPRPIAEWWAERLGGKVEQDHDGWFCIVSSPGGMHFGFQKVDDPTPGKNRIHLDLVLEDGEDRETVLAAWTAAGATHLGRRGEADFGWDTLSDPDGNEFCIADAH